MGSEDGTECYFEEEGTLPVHQVGDFEASFVPSHDDWDRLDSRFRLDPALWDQLSGYHDFGFAVFQLSPGVQPGAQRVHPMAFEFVSVAPEDLFFPTVHIYDGQVHPTADFDHDLYCQLPDGHPLLESFESDAPILLDEGHDWLHSFSAAGLRIDTARAAGLIDAEAPILLRQMQGSFLNRDVVVRPLG